MPWDGNVTPLYSNERADVSHMAVGYGQHKGIKSLRHAAIGHAQLAEMTVDTGAVGIGLVR